MTQLNYPSPTFPGEPAVSIDVPDGWERVSAVATRLAARATGEASFHTNVVVLLDRRASGTDPGVAVQELAVEAAQRPNGDVSEPFEAIFDGRTWVGCDLSWDDATVGRVLQVHLFTLVPGPQDSPVAFLVQVTGSCLASRENADFPVLKEAMSSVRLVASPGR